MPVKIAALGLLLISLSQPFPSSGRHAGQEKRQPSQPKPGSPTRPPPPAQREVSSDPEDEVVHVTTNLVQIDAVVTDGQGRRVADLRPEDFEVFAGKRRQQITNVSYISGSGPEAEPRAGANAPAQAIRRPGQARRTVALVVDNLCASFEDTDVARESLRKFINEQMQPGDLVAVVQTLGGTGALQQFTSDKRLLLAAVERVRFNLSPSRALMCAIDEMSPLASQPMNLPPAPGERAPRTAQTVSAAPGDVSSDAYGSGRFAALRFILRGLRELPGRKALVLLTDNLPSPSPGADDVKRRLDGLADLAYRASVVIYPVDLRGLPTLGLTAADSTRGMSPRQVDDLLKRRRSSYYYSQGGMEYLAHQTGGLFTRNTNDIPSGIRGVFDDQRGYYMIGFRPDAEMFDPKSGRIRYNGLRLKARRDGLNVRTRGGFYGYTEEDEDRRARPPASADQLFGALASPFGAGDVSLSMTSLFRDVADTGPALRSLLHIDLSNLSFTDEADGWRKTVFDVSAVVFDADGVVAESVSRTETVRAKGRTLEYYLRNGLVYSMNVPVKKPGAYQMRVAVRDTASGKLGAASQLVEVPDLKAGHLALSGIVMQGDAATAETSAVAKAAPESGEEDAPRDPLRGLALRQFRQGADVNYYYDIYNASLDQATRRPRLQTQVRLFRDGRLVFNGEVVPYDPGRQADMRRLAAVSRITLGKELSPGEYVLQVIVTDALAKEKHQVATQWMDFKVVG